MLALISEVHNHGSEAQPFFDRYTGLLSDPAHLAFELTLILLVDGLFLGLMWPFMKKWVKRHDEEHHS